MSTKQHTEKLNELIRSLDLSQKVLAHALGITNSLFLKKLSPKYPYYSFSEEEIIKIVIAIKRISDELRAFSGGYSRKGQYYFDLKKFQNNPEKSEGVGSGKKTKTSQINPVTI